MARLPTPRRDDLSPENQPIYDAIAASRGGSIRGPFTLLLHSPQLAGRVAHVGSYIRFESPVPLAFRCLAALVTARELDCAFEWAGWVPQGLDAGLSQATIDAVREGATPPELPADDALVISAGRQLFQGKHRLSEEDFRALIDRFGVQGAVDLTGTFGYFAMLAMTLNAYEVDVPPGGAVLPV